jgi:hypothetical protein
MPPKQKPEEEPEEEFVKVDRRASREAEEEAEPSPAEPPQEPAPEAEEGEVPEINVYSLLRMTVGMFAEQAWLHLGLRMDPRTNKTQTDLPLAKVAIDTVSFIVDQLQPDLDAAEARELEALLANLRINYVQRA